MAEENLRVGDILLRASQTTKEGKSCLGLGGGAGGKIFSLAEFTTWAKLLVFWGEQQAAAAFVATACTFYGGGDLRKIWVGILPGMRGCRPLTQDEINRVLAAFDGPTATRERAIFITALRTGMRISSILSLRVEDVAHEGKVRNRIRVRRAIVKGERSGYDMALHAEAAAALQEQINSLKDTRPMAFVFPGRFRATPLNRIRAWKIYKATLAKAGSGRARGIGDAFDPQDLCEARIHGSWP